jgi:hypothetical protein
MNPRIYVEKDGIRTDAEEGNELARFLSMGYSVVEEVVEVPVEKPLSKAEAKAKAKTDAENGGDV